MFTIGDLVRIVKSERKFNCELRSPDAENYRFVEAIDFPDSSGVCADLNKLCIISNILFCDSNTGDGSKKGDQDVIVYVIYVQDDSLYKLALESELEIVVSSS